MRDEDLVQLVDGTKEAAYVIDAGSTILAWNAGAEKLFGLSAADAIGQSCGRVVDGVDESGPVCSGNCFVKQSIESRAPLENFDMQVRTPQGRKWCSVTTMIVETAHSSMPHALHILRPIEAAKHMEFAVREFLLNHSVIDPDRKLTLHPPTTAARHAKLSGRELEVLKLLASGGSTKSIALELGISAVTVNNHIRNILRKLDCHSRLGAIRRAERAGLL